VFRIFERSGFEKARGQFPGAGINSCDDEDMPVICPTAQVLFFVGATSDRPLLRQPNFIPDLFRPGAMLQVRKALSSA
jgi:hypothetical protein